MYSFLFLLFALAICNSCPTTFPVNFLNNTCGSAVEFAPTIMEDVCYDYNDPSKCMTCDPSCCDGATWQDCLTCTGCTDILGSFYLSNGTLYAYPYNAGCTGTEFKLYACSFAFFTICGYRQLDFAPAVNGSMCVPDAPVVTTSTSTSGGFSSSTTTGSSTSGGSSSSSTTTSGGAQPSPPIAATSSAASIEAFF